MMSTRTHNPITRHGWRELARASPPVENRDMKTSPRIQKMTMEIQSES
jgi:hypothetical protein